MTTTKTPIKFESKKHGAELARRVREAMIKAEIEPTFWLDPSGSIQAAWRDYTGVMVYAEDQATADRIATWIASCLNKRGFGAWRDGALRAGEVSTEARPFASERNHGATLVVLGSWPIGD